MRLSHLVLLSLVLLPGCAFFIDGTNQTFTVRTAPEGAACNVQRDGAILATIPSTPGTLVVRRERADMMVICQKPGWAVTAIPVPSHFTGVTAGNVIIGGLTGVVVDEATQANYRYDDDKLILMAPRAAAGPSGMVTLPAS